MRIEYKCPTSRAPNLTFGFRVKFRRVVVTVSVVVQIIISVVARALISCYWSCARDF